MKNLLLVFTALLVISGIVSVNLWRDLRIERHANAELESQLANSVSIPRSSRAPATPAQSLAAPLPAALPDAAVAVAKPAQPPIESEVFARATSAVISSRATAVTGGLSERDLMKDPEYRKAQLIQARMRFAQSNPGLAEALGLSLREADHLFEVMAESQLTLTVELTEMTANAGGAAPSIAAMMQSMAGRQDPARAVLGEARYEQYQEYQRNVRPVLNRVSTMGNTLNATGQPLNDSQARALANVFLSEQQLQRQEAVVPRPNLGAQRSAADTMAEYQKTQEDTDRRLLQAATPHLNAAQIDVLQKRIEQQAIESRRTLETARDLDARRSSQPQPGSPPARAP